MATALYGQKTDTASLTLRPWKPTANTAAKSVEVGTASYACYALYNRDTGQGLTRLSTAPFFHKIVGIVPVPFKGDLYCTGDEYKNFLGGRGWFGTWGGKKNSDSARSRRSYGKTGDYEQSRMEMDFSSYSRELALISLIVSLVGSTSPPTAPPTAPPTQPPTTQSKCNNNNNNNI